MIEISSTMKEKISSTFKHMEDLRTPWESVWRDLSKMYMPRTYVWLATDKQTRSPQAGRNSALLSSTSIQAANVLANGLMDGITSPSRVWFRLYPRRQNQNRNLPYDVAVWLEDTRSTIMAILAASNFYPAMRKQYKEFGIFGTSALGMNPDPDTLIRFRNFAIGEFYLLSDDSGRVVKLGRKFRMTAEEMVREFGESNCPETVVQQSKQNNGGRFVEHTIFCLVEKNEDDDLSPRRSAKYRELYWTSADNAMTLLRKNPHDTLPYLAPRWETYARDTYGTSPAWDGLPDVFTRQHMIRRRGQGIDRTVSPPIVYNRAMLDNPEALLAGGAAPVKSGDLKNVAAPAYQINPAFQEFSIMLQENASEIQMVLFNDVFQAVSRLNTVRSATEIEALKAERLVLLSPMLEQFERDTLTPAIQFAYQEGRKAGLIDDPPESITELGEIEIRYVGILAEAQRAVSVASTERYLQVLGNMAAIYPEDVLDVPDAEAILRDYADQIGLRPDLNRSPEGTAERRKAREDQRLQQQQAIQGQTLIGGAQQLSETDLGGGQNALNAMLG